MLSDMSFKSFKKYINNVILAKFKIFWADFRANNMDGKLRTYFSFKEHFEFEQYLNIIKNFDKRRSLMISAQDLKLKEEDFLNHLFLLKIDSVIIVHRKLKMNFIF